MHVDCVHEQTHSRMCSDVGRCLQRHAGGIEPRSPDIDEWLQRLGSGGDDAGSPTEGASGAGNFTSSFSRLTLPHLE